MSVEMTREDQVKAVCFAAGTAAFMACIERAVVVSLFAHWRVWAFLALNLLLLAILFTSKSQFPPIESKQDDITSSENDSDSGKKEKQEIDDYTDECPKDVFECEDSVDNKTKNVQDCGNDDEDEEQEEELKHEISKEELNKKVEAFITMFRQHLVSDAKNCKRYRMHQLNSDRRASFSYDYKHKYIST